MKCVGLLFAGTLLVVQMGAGSGCVVATVETGGTGEVQASAPTVPQGDQELARLLVKLEKQTRAVVAGHYVGADADHRAWLAEEVLLPAAVADKVFHRVVPETTSGRAWVKMVVDQPRNPHNAGDTTAQAMLQELREGKTGSHRSMPDAYYYAEPIKAAKTCLLCHGRPAGQPDPFFPQYKKNGWEEGEVIGAIVARVAPAS